MFKLKGKALFLKEAIYDRKEEKTIEQWTKKLYPKAHPRDTSSVRYLINTLLRAGFPVVSIGHKMTQEGGIAGVLKPLTTKNSHGLEVNDRYERRLRGNLNTLQEMMFQECLADPKITKLVVETIDRMSENHFNMRKYVLAYASNENAGKPSLLRS